MKARCSLALLIAAGLAALAAAPTSVVAEERSSGNDLTKPMADPAPAVAREAGYADRAAAEVLLYRWWGLFELPEGADLTPSLNGLFANDVSISMGMTELAGLPAVTSALAHLPKGEARAHHLKSFALKDLEDGRLRLNAQFIYQVRGADGSLRSGEGVYEHDLSRRSDGRLTFSRLTVRVGSPVDLPQFMPSFERNRAKATLIAFQALLDGAGGSGADLADLLTPDALLRDPPLASGSGDAPPEQVGFDVETLRRTLGQGYAVPVATGHRLAALDVKPLGNGRYQANAQFEQFPIGGSAARVESQGLREWVLAEDGASFMRIQQLR